MASQAAGPHDHQYLQPQAPPDIAELVVTRVTVSGHWQSTGIGGGEHQHGVGSPV
jgi:hypothetical protein